MTPQGEEIFAFLVTNVDVTIATEFSDPGCRRGVGEDGEPVNGSVRTTSGEL